jgi:hypothetical protein
MIVGQSRALVRRIAEVPFQISALETLAADDDPKAMRRYDALMAASDARRKP